jgi:hypothetical protein
MEWLCVGDFNEVLDNFEKFGGLRKPQGQMDNFQEALDLCQLSDLGYSRPKFTWCNHRHGAQFTKERLDRAVATTGWCDLFSHYKVEILVATSSDHASLFMSYSKIGEPVRKKVRLFRYEACWACKKELKEVIKKVWRAKSTRPNVWVAMKEKIQRCQHELSTWHKANSGQTKMMIKQKTRQLEELQGGDDFLDLANISKIQEEVHDLME